MFLALVALPLVLASPRFAEVRKSPLSISSYRKVFATRDGLKEVGAASMEPVLVNGTAIVMANQPGFSYTENFTDIANWTNGFASGIGAAPWASLAVNALGTIPDGKKVTVATTAFSSGTSGGVQRGSGTIVLLSTGVTDNTSSTAIDFFADFTGVNAGTVSFDWAEVDNSTGDKKGSVRVYTSTDGSTWTELTAAQVLNVTNNVASSGSITNVALPASFNNSSTARIRLYYHNGTGGTTGSRPKISIDNFTVTAIANTISGTLNAGGSSSGKTITLLKNGVFVGSNVTGGGGAYSISGVSYSSGDILTVFVDDDATVKGGTVTRGNSGDITGLNIDQNTLTVRHEDAGPITNANLGTGNNGDADLNAVYSVSGVTGALGVANTLTILSGKTFTPGATINTTNLTNAGTLNGGSNLINISGVFTNSGIFNKGTSTVNYSQSSDGQNVLALDYATLQFSNFNKVLASSGTIGITTGFSPGPATGHTVTGSTLEYHIPGAGTTVLPPLFVHYNNLTSNSPGSLIGPPGLIVDGTLEVAQGSFTSASDYNNVVIDSGATLTLSGDVTVSGNWTNNGTFNNGGFKVTFDGTTNQTIGGSSVSAFANLTISNTGAAGSNTVSLAQNVSDTALNVTAGIFDQGSSSSLTSGAVTVSSGATWNNIGTGDLTLSGDVANAGTINFNANGLGCGQNDDILIRSSASPTQRAWSGAGTFSMTDVDVKDQAGSAVIIVKSGSDSGHNSLNWHFLSVAASCNAYTWTGAINSDWTNPLNWSPARTATGPSDILYFTSGVNVTNVAGATGGNTETIAELHINGASPNFSTASGGNTLLINAGSGFTGLDINSAFPFAISGSNPLTIKLAAGTLGNISGNATTVQVSGGAHRIIGQLANAITFQTGTNFTTDTGFTGNAFGTGTGDSSVNGAVVFASGSSYNQHAGGNPFGDATHNVVSFDPNSTASFFTASGFSANGRTYGTLVIGDGTTPVSVSDTGDGDFAFYGLTINNATGGTFPVLTYTGTGPSTVYVRGNVASNGGSGSAQDIRLGGGTGGVVLDGAGSISLTDNSSNSRAIEFTSNASVTNGTAIVSLSRKVLLGQVQPSNLLLSVPAASVINPAGNTNYVIGKVLMNFDASHTSHTFPVGNATSEGYSPLVVSNASGTGSLTVNARSPGLPAISGANKLNRYWQITKGGSLASADLAFHYPASAAAAGAEANYKFFRYDSGNVFTTYDVSSLTTTDPNDHIATLNGVTNFSDWTLAEPSSVPSLSIDANVSQAEGDSGQANVTFNVNLSPPSGQTVTVHYSTANGTATGGATCGAGTDYLTTSGTLTFTPSVTAQAINVPICGDKLVEPNETFTVTIDTPANALITSATGIGTIQNDDSCVAPSTVYVNKDWAGVTPGTDPDGAGPATNFGCASFATVQGGVNGVAPGGTVNVAAGTYTENVTINKALTLTGAGKGADDTTNTVLTNSGGVGITITASDVTVGYLRVRDYVAGGFSDYGIRLTGGALNNVLIDHVAATNTATGVALQGTDNKMTNITVQYCDLIGNRDTGLFVYFPTYVDGLTIDHCDVENNVAEGIELYQEDVSSGLPLAAATSTNVHIKNSTVSHNGDNQPGDQGFGNITVYGVNGDIDISDVTIDATLDDYGIYLRGHLDVNDDPTAGGTMTLTNVSVSGAPLDWGLHVAWYTTVNLGFSGFTSNVNLASGASPDDHPRAAIFMRHLGAINSFNLGNTIIGGTRGTGAQHPYDLGASHANINATGVTFTQTAPPAIENVVLHKLDVSPFAGSDPTGLVTWVANNIYVTADSGSIQRGIDAAANSGDTVNVQTGTYTGDVSTAGKSVTLSPGASPGQVTINGNLTLDSTDTIPIEINGTNAATDFDNFIVNGGVTLGNATLSLSGTHTPIAGQTFKIIDNDALDSISGTFNGLPEGAIITNFLGSSLSARITYQGGTDNNDVVLTVVTPNTNPTITAATGLSRQQGSAVSNSQIATVNDAESGANGVTVKVNGSAAATVNGVTVSNIVNTNGTVTADIIAGCNATDAVFTLTADDGQGGTNTASLTITVTANDAPTISYTSPQTVALGGSLTINPASFSDNGTIDSVILQSAGTYNGGITVDSSGVVSITNAAPIGTHPITIRATDNCGSQTDAQFTLEVTAVCASGPIVINNTGDGPDATPGDGVCETGASSGICTLRAAIMEANAEGSCPSPIQIQFGIASPGVQTISPASPLPAVTVPVTIDGYSQPGTSVNTFSDSTDNAVLLIELTGVNAGAGADGVVISGGDSTVEGLIINRFLGAGVKLTGVGTNNVTGNFIGTDATGMLTVDGSNAPYGNHVGVFIDNTGDNMIGCDTEDERNVISGNVDDGISIAGVTASQNLVWGNLIGVGAGGTALANGGAGVAIYDASDNSIGLDVDGNGRGNVIGFNGGNGVEVKFGTMIGPAPPTHDNIISQNSIHDNVGLGIDLGDPGVTPNDETSPPFDSDSGPNDLQNFPEINVATAGSTNTISGNFHSTPDQTFTLEFFASTACNGASPNDYGEGQMYLGAASVSTDLNGDTPFVFNPSLLTPGQVVTATATDANGNTSEFSQCFPVTSANANPTITAATGLSRQQGSPQSNLIIATVSDTESGPNGVTVTVTSANPSNGVTISNIQNANDNSGHITADIIADCTATDPATFTLQASDGSGGTATDTLTITVTPKATPTLTYNTPQTVTEGNSLTINPATSGNAASFAVQDAGGYPGSLSVDNSTGVVTISNAVSPGSYTIKIRATSNCTDQTDATFTLTVNAAACDTPPAGMVAWYPGDGNADDIQGPTFESGTLHGGATFSAGKVNQAFAFDGADTSYVEVPDSPNLDSTTGTWDFWIKTTQTAGSGNPIGIMSKANSVASLSGATVFTSTGTISVTFKDDTGGSGHEWNVDGTRIINDGQWHHVAITFRAGGTANLYTDGTPDGNAPIGNFTLGAFPIRLARNTDAFWQTFNGQLDEVEVFNVELSASDVANINNASFAGKCRTCTPPPGGMVSWYPAEGNADDIGGPNNGTFNGTPAYANGKVGQAFSFNGNPANYVSVPANSNLQLAQLTVDAWIYPTTTTGVQYFLDKGDNGGENYLLALTSDHKVEFDFNIGGHHALDSTAPVPANVWSHVTGTYDGATLKLYINGSLDGTLAAPVGAPSGGQRLTIGVRSDGTSPFQGLVDEVEIFNRALSPAEVAAIADAGSTGKCHTSTVTVAVSPSAVLEDDAANFVYTFTRSGDLTSPLTVNFSVGGTATFSSDYTQSGAATFSASAGTVDFPANTSTATVTIDPTPDTTYELAESVMLTVSPSANYSVGSPAQGTGTISNDDDAPVLKIGNVTAFEGTNPPGTTPFTFTVTKTGSTEATATVNFDTVDGATNPATGGGSCGGSVDYISQTGGVISFAPNETSKTFTIQVCRDATAEANETFLVELSAATHATIAEGEGRGTIQNDDTPPPLSPVNTTDDTNDGVCNATHCSLREAINQANLASTPVSITFAIPDDDHLNAGGPRHFYYKNDGVANHVTNDVSHIGITLTGDATPPTDIDPDWPHSWWSIQTSSALPTVSAQSLISIDAYTQTGASANTLTGADNAVLRIELTPGGSVPASTTGLSLSGLTASVRGLVVNRFSGDGVRVASGNKSLTGNFIGPDVSGTLDLGNTGSGINSPSGFSETIGGGTAADINLISGNNGNGLSFNNSNTNLVLGNLIGTKADGAGSLGNSGTGIGLSGPGSVANTIGGTNSGEGNTIAFNGADGVRLADASFGNGIRGNSIFSNGSTANDLGIDLGTDGVTANDSMDGDAGPNALQNFPVITLAQVTGSTRTITGTLNSTPNETFNIDFYSNASCDTLGGYGEGKTYLGSISVTTDNTTGDAPFTFHPTTLTIGQVVTATATSTGAQFNTSEFSACVAVQSGDAGAGDIQFTSATYTVNENDASQIAQITLTRAGGTNGQIQTSFTTSNGSATAGSDYTDSSQTVVFNEGETSKTINIPISDDGVYEGDETVNLTLGITTINARDGGGKGNSSSLDPHVAVLTIVENDPAPTLAIDDVTQNEGSGGTTTFTFHITKTGATDLGASVTINTANGTASAPADYAAITNQLVTFPASGPGSTTQTVAVTVTADATTETDETFFVNLSSPTNATISDSQGLGTITNDDTDVSVAISSPVAASVAEDGATNLVYRFTRAGVTSNSLTVNFSVAGTATFNTDYTQSGAATFSASSGTVTFGAGNSTADITIDPTADTNPESDETVILTVTSGSGYNVASPSSATGTISNDDACPATFIVNDNGDASDTSAGDGHCDTDGNLGNGDQCTLRAAIEEANALTSCGTIDINFSGVVSPINLNSALAAINHNVNITGPSARGLTVQRNPAGGTPQFRVLTINPATTVQISSITISNGRTADDGTGKGAGVLNNGSLTMIRVAVSGNTSGSGSSAGNGGAGIFNGGTLNLISSTVSGNTTGNGVAGPSAPGGYGGGIYSDLGTNLTILNSTISGNTTGNGGVGTSGGYGGGIYNLGSMSVINTTVANNHTGGGMAGGFGGGICCNGTLGNTIVANNTVAPGGSNPDLQGTFTSQDYNLIKTGGSFTGPTSHNITGVDPMLGPLANNGGPTQTYALLPGSPATNAGSNGNLPLDTFDLDGDTITNETLPVDQRGVGFNRIINSTVDIGAVEVNYAISTTAGSGQNAQINSTFGTALKATVTEAGNAVSGIPVTFTAPASGPGGTFASSATVNTDANGVATAPVFTANGISNNATPYNVTASLAGGVGSTNFSLTNLKGDQTINFGALSNKTFGDADFNTSASATSGLPVSFSVASGQCSITGNTVHLTGAGSCTIAASQGGDNNYNGAPSVQQSFNIAKANTSTVVFSSPNPSDAGQNVTFTAQVSSNAGTPTGTVLFKDGNTAIPCSNGGGQALSAGVSTCQTTTLSTGTHVISGEYSGDINFNSSTGIQAQNQVVRSQPSLSINDVSATEGDSGTKNFNFTVTLSLASSPPVSVDYVTANGTTNPATGGATCGSGSDYVTTSGTLNFAAGETTKTATVQICGDQSFEPNETFSVNLSNAMNATISDNQGLGTIVNDDAQGGVITFSQSNYTVNESGGSATITVNRTGDTSGSASVDYATPDDSEVASVPPCSQTDGIARPRCDFTTALGTLQFAPGESSKTFTVLISQDNFAEGPEGLQLALSNLTGGAVFGANSTAVLTINDDPTEPSTNPIDDPENFVRQHYHDFLNREPDAPGLAFWIGNFTECASNAQCIEVKRINVSAAFYLSIEFQQTGYLVERMYKSAYGDVTASSGLGGTHQIAVPIVRYTEFLRDTQKIGEGVIVNTDPNWQQKLEANKVKFAEDFVQRQRFTNAYPTTLSPDTFVNQLFANTGVTPSAQERQDAINEFGGAPNISNVAARARATRRIAENGSFTQQEFNRAFVLMQYFGYLRRNPNAEASADYTGFDFWLTKLNQFNGNFQNAEMVKAFLSSIEYRNRFGN